MKGKIILKPLILIVFLSTVFFYFSWREKREVVAMGEAFDYLQKNIEESDVKKGRYPKATRLFDEKEILFGRTADLAKNVRPRGDYKITFFFSDIESLYIAGFYVSNRERWYFFKSELANIDEASVKLSIHSKYLTFFDKQKKVVKFKYDSAL